jgi:hypothetical protein
VLPQSTARHYLEQQHLAAATLTAVAVLWARMGYNLDESFAVVGPQLVAVITAAQLGAASSSDAYVAAALEETQVTAPPVAAVNPAAFAGVASGGGSLSSLVEQALIRTKTALMVPGVGQSARFGVQVGASPEVRMQQALQAGRRWLGVAVQSEVADAERGATQTAMCARPKVQGYTRMLNLPCCKRCAVLAGKWYKWNASFKRHPGCQCRGIPAQENLAYDLTTNPDVAYASGQVTGIKKVDQQAIADGADFSQIVNARRQFAVSSDGMWTSEGATRRGFANARIRALRNGVDAPGKRVLRPTVDQIYKYAESREDAIKLLYRTGYII